MLKIVLDPPPKIFFFSGIEDFAVLGAYIIDYIRALVPNGVYLNAISLVPNIHSTCQPPKSLPQSNILKGKKVVSTCYILHIDLYSSSPSSLPFRNESLMSIALDSSFVTCAI